MADSLDLGDLEVEAGSVWGAYREIVAYVVTQTPKHPGVDVFIVHAEVQGSRTSVSVNSDGTLESKNKVERLMADWIEESNGE